MRHCSARSPASCLSQTLVVTAARMSSPAMGTPGGNLKVTRFAVKKAGGSGFRVVLGTGNALQRAAFVTAALMEENEPLRKDAAALSLCLPTLFALLKCLAQDPSQEAAAALPSLTAALIESLPAEATGTQLLPLLADLLTSNHRYFIALSHMSQAHTASSRSTISLIHTNPCADLLCCSSKWHTMTRRQLRDVSRVAATNVAFLAKSEWMAQVQCGRAVCSAGAQPAAGCS